MLQYILVVSQISLIIIHLQYIEVESHCYSVWQPVKTHRRICGSASNLIATYYSDQSFQTVAAKCKKFGRLPLLSKEQSNKKLPMTKLYYPSLLRFIGGNSHSLNFSVDLLLYYTTVSQIRISGFDWRKKTTKEAVCRVAAKVCTWHFRSTFEAMSSKFNIAMITGEEGKHCWKRLH